MKNNYLVQAWLVLTLGLVFGGALAAVQAGLSPRIEANKRNKTYEQIPLLVPGADRTRTQETRLDGRLVFRACDSDGRQVGWVLPGRGQGFVGVIELLIGLDLTCRNITGLSVLVQTETPGLGARIADEWKEQFAEKDASAPLTVTKKLPATGNQVHAITGATISSESVCKIANEALETMRPRLLAEKE